MTFLSALRGDAGDRTMGVRGAFVVGSSWRAEDRRGGEVSSEGVGRDVIFEGARGDMGDTGSGIVYAFEDEGRCDCVFLCVSYPRGRYRVMCAEGGADGIA